MLGAVPISLAKATWRGLLGRCPRCGQGKMFRRFLKVAHHCEVCGEELCHERADDFTAYLVILLVGHAVLPAAFATEMAFSPSLFLQLLVWVPVIVVMSLALLQPTKGAIIGLQWQMGMHGFEASKQRRDAPSRPRS
jgi:uncharacterized protein (DUF983 family)